jgi:hypothetical protein
MGDPYYFSVSFGNDRTLCIAPLTTRRVEQSGQKIKDLSGYYLYETNRCEEPPTVRIIAKLVSEEEAFCLSEMLQMR